MSTWNNWPSYDQFLSAAWGWPNEVTGFSSLNVSNVVTGTNPPYTAADFLTMYPKFGGNPLILNGTITQGSAVVTGVDTTAGLTPGQPVASYLPLNGQLLPGYFPAGTTIVSVDTQNQITLSSIAITAPIGGVGQVAVYTAPFAPLVVINVYIALATASLVQARWLDAWPVAMGWFIAHFLTLWLQSDGSVYTSAGQVAQAGANRGILTSKSADGVSAGIQPVSGLDSWAAWNMTSYGVQFATMAKVVGGGPLLLW